MISERTKAALARVKAQGKKLGNPDQRRMSAAGAQARRRKAAEFAATIFPVIEQIRSRGVTSQRAIAAELDRMRVATVTGAPWSGFMVGKILARTEGKS